MAVQFESTREKEQLREEKRIARQEVIEDAKHKYEKAKWREEQAKKRGEDTWMLPSISSRLENEQSDITKSKKKKSKKEKIKHKKSKKKKKHKKRDTNSDSDSEGEAKWIESTATSNDKFDAKENPVKSGIGPKLERDSWMDSPLDFLPTVTRKDLRAEKEKQLEEDRQKLVQEAGQHPKELNPYWKDGGMGLPENETNPTEPASSVKVAGDAGLSWWKRAYERCVEQANEEGKPLEEIAADRYGSLEKLQSMIAQAESAHEASSRSRCGRDYHQPSQHNRNRDQMRNRRDYSRRDDRDDRSHEKYHSDRSSSRDRSERKDYKYDDTVKERDSGHSLADKKRSFMRPREGDGHERSKVDRTKLSFRKPGTEDDYSYRSSYKEDDKDSRTDKKKMSFRKPESGGEYSLDKRADEQYRGRQSGASGWKKKPERQETESDRQSSEKNEATLQQGQSNKTSMEYSESSSSDSSSAESEDEPIASQEPVQLLTEQEMNEIGAKIVKAEIMGDVAMAKQLKDRLESARQAAKAPPKVRKTKGKEKNEDEDDLVILTRTDRSGMTRPLPSREHPVEPQGGRRKKQKVETHEDSGERKRYFDDDDKYDLKTLVERERMGTAEDSNMMFARLAGRTFEKTNDDEEHQVDDVFMQRASKKQSDSKQEDREKHLAVLEHKKTKAALEKCRYCFENVAKHLIVSIGRKVYLSLPNHKSMAEGHCLIVPMQHVTQATVMDEDVWDEVQAFRRCLTQMFQERDEDCVFMETSMALHKMPHMAIECVPMPREVGDMAPIYFKKAIMDSESEWAQNKKVIDLSKKNIRNAVPKGFPYFSVDFGMQGGFAHVIEDEKTFTWYFGREVCGGMMDLDPGFWRKPHKESFDSSRRKVLEFEKMWKPHDWTQGLKSSG